MDSTAPLTLTTWDTSPLDHPRTTTAARDNIIAVALELLATTDVLCLQELSGEEATALFEAARRTAITSWCPRGAGIRYGYVTLIARHSNAKVDTDQRAVYADEDPGRHPTGNVAHLIDITVDGRRLTVLNTSFTDADLPADRHPAVRQARWLTTKLDDTERQPVIIAGNLHDTHCGTAHAILDQHHLTTPPHPRAAIISRHVDIDVEITTTPLDGHHPAAQAAITHVRQFEDRPVLPI